jgi:hypothetical protein
MTYRTTFSTLEEALTYASHVLQCASVTAYESGDRHKGEDRDLAFSSKYLIDHARAVIDESLSGLDAR